MAVPTYVVGHRNPDTDSIVSAVAYAQLLTLQGQENVIAARAGELRRETSYLLDRFDVDPPRLLEDVRVRVGDVMTSPARTVGEGDSLYEVGKSLQDLGMRPLPVVDLGGRLRGIAEAQDFAKVFFQGLDPELADHLPIDPGNLAEALGATVLSSLGEGVERRAVMVAARSLESVSRGLEPGSVLVVGDRLDVQRAAVEMGVGVLIVTGGAPVADEVVTAARHAGVGVLAVQHHTAATLRLIHMSVPVNAIMRREPPSCEPDDLVDDVRDLLAQERALSVVDDSRHVVGVVTRADVLRGTRRRIVLVDHNERSQAVDGIEQAEIVGVIDHHRVADLITAQPPLMRLEPLGACSSLVAKLYAEAEISVPAPMAGIMLGAILADTLLFQSPTTTDEDRTIAQKLASIAGVGPDELGRAMIEISSDVSDRTARQLVRSDLKSYVIDDERFAVGAVETGNAANVLDRRDQLLAEMEELREEGYSLVLLMVTDVLNRRTTLLVLGHEDAVARAFEARLTDENRIELDGVYSRKKQIVPLLGRVRELI